MKEPKDKKARKKSLREFEAHKKAGGTREEWNKMHDITADHVRKMCSDYLENMFKTKRED